MAERIDGRFELSARVTPANGITLIRLLATPVVLMAVLRFGPTWGTFLAWVALASTDFVDGWVARRQGVTTSGAFLDPLADKSLVLGALVALAAGGQIGWWPVALIGGREVAISAYRCRARPPGDLGPGPAARQGQDRRPGRGRRPSCCCRPSAWHHAWLGRDLLWVAVVLALVSGAQYLLDGRHAPVPPLSQALVEPGDGYSPS